MATPYRQPDPRTEICATCDTHAPADHGLPAMTFTAMINRHECGTTCHHCDWRVIAVRNLCRTCFNQPSIRAQYPTVKEQRKVAVIEDVQEFLETGASKEEAASRLGMKPNSMRDLLRKVGRPDLWLAFKQPDHAAG